LLIIEILFDAITRRFSICKEKLNKNERKFQILNNSNKNLSKNYQFLSINNEPQRLFNEVKYMNLKKTFGYLVDFDIFKNMKILTIVRI